MYKLTSSVKPRGLSLSKSPSENRLVRFQTIPGPTDNILLIGKSEDVKWTLIGPWNAAETTANIKHAPLTPATSWPRWALGQRMPRGQSPFYSRIDDNHSTRTVRRKSSIRILKKKNVGGISSSYQNCEQLRHAIHRQRVRIPLEN